MNKRFFGGLARATAVTAMLASCSSNPETTNVGGIQLKACDELDLSITDPINPINQNGDGQPILPRFMVYGTDSLSSAQVMMTYDVQNGSTSESVMADTLANVLSQSNVDTYAELVCVVDAQADGNIELAFQDGALNIPSLPAS